MDEERVRGGKEGRKMKVEETRGGYRGEEEERKEDWKRGEI